MSGREIIVIDSPALRLALRCAVDESPHHIELSPVDLVGIRWVDIVICFMCSYKIGHVDLPGNLVRKPHERRCVKPTMREYRRLSCFGALVCTPDVIEFAGEEHPTIEGFWPGPGTLL
jgi:hypothetical protein